MRHGDFTGDPERFRKSYWAEHISAGADGRPLYFAGAAARTDRDGYFG